MPWPSAPIVAVLLAAAGPIAYPVLPATADFTVVARWARLHTEIGPDDLIDVRDGYAFALLATPAPQGPRTLHLEAVDNRTWRRLGGRSADLRIELSCEPPRVTATGLVIYGGSNRLGAIRLGADPATLHLSANTLDVLAAALCTPAMQARPPMTDPRPPPAPQAPTPLPTTAAVTPPEAVAVQIGAYFTPADAMNAIHRLGLAMRGLLDHRLTRLEPVQAGRRTVYRALLTGFDNDAEATRFCRALIRARHTCLVRKVR